MIGVATEFASRVSDGLNSYLGVKSNRRKSERSLDKLLLDRLPLTPLAYPYATARSLMFTAERLMAPLIDIAILHRRPELPIHDPELFREVRQSLEAILKKDVENIRAGLYPLDVLKPENPVRHLARLPKMFFEGIEIARRRREHASDEFSERAKSLLSDQDVPEYYKRNFHFQGDGYLSDQSAELYEHQVEILFAGAADAMRRLIIAPMKRHFNNSDGEGLKFLEIGAGTGRATKFVRLAFPKAKIVAVDLSSPYLKRAQSELKNFARHDFIEAGGEKLPFKDESFDAVYSVFLFHELPMDVRKTVIKENLRVLKAGGFYGFVDSIQKGDWPSFDTSLERFPVEFHEPFYTNYVKHPMEELLTDAKLEAVSSENAFFSKCVTSRKPVA